VKQRREYILRNEKVFVGVDDSKKTWSLCIHSGSQGVIDLHPDILLNVLAIRFTLWTLG